VRAQLLELVGQNPHDGGEGRFVFHDVRPDRPMRGELLRDGLEAALLRLRLTEEELKKPEKVREARKYWRDRRVCYHSWRHSFATRMADVLDQRAMALTGHKTAAVFEHYANHRNEAHFRQAAEAHAKVYGQVIPFAREAREVAG